MQCAACGAHASDDQRFCGQCGAPLVAACGNCGTENPPSNRFCGACGSALSEPSTEADRQSTERRVVSVMFIDLVGFTTYSEGRDPEDVRALITRYFDVAKDILDRFGGTVDKFIGDAVMAWWGATTSHEDDAERAVRSSMEIVEAVSSLGEEVGIPDLRARAGVMTGEASVGPGGNEKGLLLGDLVNSASRLQALAPPGTVYVGDTTKSLVETAIELDPAGTHEVKGKEETITAWHARRVLAERGGRGRVDVLEPPFVGRVAELRMLKDALHATGQEHRARLLSIVGQAGIGKSRLVWEFLKYIDGLVDDIYWHEGRSPSYGDGIALWALGEMVRARAGIQETDRDDVTAARLDETVHEYVDADRAEWVRERLASLLGLPGAGLGERSELYSAARAFFESIASRGTTVLVFEDLHWADPGLLEFIEEMPDWSQNHPILIVTLTRPDLLDRRPDWGSGRRGFTSVYLTPLTDSEMAELISGTINDLPGDAVEQIAQAAAGVPLFAVEMMRMLIGDGTVVLDDDGRATSVEITELEVPSSVQAIISARLDRLPAEERDLARDASVMGFSFTLDGIASLRDESLDKLERRLGDLIRHEILELVRDPRSPERGQYQWVQSVLREVAYNRISRDDKRDLHVRVARYLAGLGDPELAPVAASHYIAASEQGAEDDESLRGEMVAVLNAAIDRARTIHAYEQVLGLVDTALPFVSREEQAELHEIGAFAAVRLNDPESADRHVADFRTLAGSDESMMHRVMGLFGTVMAETQRTHLAVDELIAYGDKYPDLSSDPHLAHVAMNLGRAHMLDGRMEDGAAWSDKAIGPAERLHLYEIVAHALITQGTALAAERYHQGMALLRGGLELAKQIGDNTIALRGMVNIGYASTDAAETLRVQQEGYELASRVGDRNGVAFLAGNLASVYLYELAPDDLEDLLEDSVVASANYLALDHARAELLYVRGRTEEADRLADSLEPASVQADAQTVGSYERVLALRDFLRGDYQESWDVGWRHLSESQLAQALSLGVALSPALFMRDRDKLVTLQEMSRSFPAGDYNDALLTSVAASVALIKGDVDEAIAITDGIDGRLRQHSKFTWFRHYLGLARILPADHEARLRYYAEALRMAEEGGAHGLVAFAQRAIDE